MKIQQAIEKAIEGGWRDEATRDLREVDAEFWARTLVVSSPVQVYLLEPLFWQALFGKEKVDWGNGRTEEEYQKDIDELKSNGFSGKIRKFGIDGKQEKWKWHWDCFFNHLAEGKDIKSYFESL